MAAFLALLAAWWLRGLALIMLVIGVLGVLAAFWIWQNLAPAQAPTLVLAPPVAEATLVPAVVPKPAEPTPAPKPMAPTLVVITTATVPAVTKPITQSTVMVQLTPVVKPPATTIALASPMPAPVVAPATPVAMQQPSEGLFGLPPQPQIGHPSFYAETGVRNTKRWQMEVLPGMVAIIGGFVVDGVSGGVYKAVGPGMLDTIVTDGFVAVIKREWGRDEFCFRIGQASQLGWAHNTVRPLSGWAPC